MHDILFRIPLPFGVLPIHSYGVMIMIGFLLGLGIARWRAKKVGLDRELITDVAVWALLAGIVGSRIFYVAQNGQHFFDTSRPGWSLFDMFKIWQGGLVFYGGFIGAAAATLIILRLRKQKLLPVLDVFTPSVALGHAFGRMGCFLRGCCYGRPVSPDAWYGVQFPPDSTPYDSHALMPIPPGSHLFPTQLLSSLDLLVIFALLMLFFPRRRAVGQVTALYLILYGIHRFSIEIFRGDTHAPGELSPAQWISLVAFFGGLALLVRLHGEPTPNRKFKA
jgi:phosphatidylglycerol:prolipoprotein diacylglycerol transferase